MCIAVLGASQKELSLKKKDTSSCQSKKPYIFLPISIHNCTQTYPDQQTIHYFRAHCAEEEVYARSSNLKKKSEYQYGEPSFY
jgi:hypothetical protein